MFSALLYCDYTSELVDPMPGFSRFYTASSGKRAPCTMGTAKSVATVLTACAPQPRRERIFVTRVSPETTLESFFEYCRSISDSFYSVSRFKKHEDAVLRSFLVTTSKADASLFLDPSHWPEGILIKKFRFKSPFQDKLEETVLNEPSKSD